MSLSTVSTPSTLDDTPPLISDPVEAAKFAGLRYFTDIQPGIRRRRAGKHFSYTNLDGVPIRDRQELARIKSIGIPPAWTDVWICSSARGHIQATGRDSRGRKQYRYHQKWREIRDETKYTRMIAFGDVLPRIRQATDRDLSLKGMSREKVLATITQLLDETAIRIGNEEYARENQSFGLTTMQPEHVDINGSAIQFHFRGKSGKDHIVNVRDRRLARAVKRCTEIDGQELFRFEDGDGASHPVDSSDVNEYLRHVTGENFTAKDFRTWHGTVTAARALYDLGGVDSEAEAKKNITTAITAAAQVLGNTPAICRKSYIHPSILEAYLDGSFIQTWARVVNGETTGSTPELEPHEMATLAILQEQQDHGRRTLAAS